MTAPLTAEEHAERLDGQLHDLNETMHGFALNRPKKVPRMDQGAHGSPVREEDNDRAEARAKANRWLRGIPEDEA